MATEGCGTSSSSALWITRVSSKCGRCWVLVLCVLVSGTCIRSVLGNGMLGGEAPGPGAALGASGNGGKKRLQAAQGIRGVCGRMLRGWHSLLATRQYLPARRIAFVSQRKQRTDIIPRHVPPRVPAALSSGRAELPAKLAKPTAEPRLPAALVPPPPC